MLNEQHMPRFEGNKVKILGQGRVKPFQAHHLNIPEIKMNHVKFISLIGVLCKLNFTILMIVLACYIPYIKTW